MKSGGLQVKNRRGIKSLRARVRRGRERREWTHSSSCSHPAHLSRARPTTLSISGASTWHNIGGVVWCHLPPNDSCKAVTTCRSAQIYPYDRQLECNITQCYRAFRYASLDKTLASKKMKSKEKCSDSNCTFSTAKVSVWGFTEFLAVSVTHVTWPGELAQLSKPAVLADAASTWTVAVTW